MMNKQSAASTTEAPELLLSRVFDAPRDLVFRIWSDPEHVKRWWHPRGFTTPVFRSKDFRVGGAYRYCIRDKGRDGWAQARTARSSCPNGWPSPSNGRAATPLATSPTLITLRFEAQGEKTLFTFHQAPFASVQERDGHAGGWGQVFDSFEQFLVTRQEAS